MVRAGLGFHQRAERLAGNRRGEERDLAERIETGVCDEPACLQAAQVWCSAQRVDDGITSVRAHQIDALELAAEAQVCDSLVGDAALPGHLESTQIGKMAEHREPTVGNLAAWVLAQFELLELR